DLRPARKRERDFRRARRAAIRNRPSVPIPHLPRVLRPRPRRIRGMVGMEGCSASFADRRTRQNHGGQMIGDYPALKDMPTNELATLMMACTLSRDPLDKVFAKACREELKRRKPSPIAAVERDKGE